MGYQVCMEKYVAIAIYLKEKCLRYNKVQGQKQQSLTKKFDIKLRPRHLEYIADNTVTKYFIVYQNSFYLMVVIQVIFITMIGFVTWTTCFTK